MYISSEPLPALNWLCVLQLRN